MGWVGGEITKCHCLLAQPRLVGARLGWAAEAGDTKLVGLVWHIQEQLWSSVPTVGWDLGLAPRQEHPGAVSMLW